MRLAGREVDGAHAPGIFSPDGLDKGTAVLLREVPAPPASGNLLDLGCGWGPIALTLAPALPRASVWAVDVNERSLDLAAHQRPLAGPGRRAEPSARTDMPGDVRFDAIWSNPPIRVGKAALHDLLLTWLPRLDAGGVAYLVVQKNLGSDSLQRWLAQALPADTFTVSRYASDKGFRVLAVTRAS